MFILASALIILGVTFFTAKHFLHEMQSSKPKQKQSAKHTDKKPRISYKYTQSAPVPAVPAAVQPKAATMAIVLDDWGNNYAVLKEAIAVGKPLTLAVMPKLAFSQKIATEAHANGLGVILHMPMQPFKTSDQLEPHTIKVDMSEKQVIQYLDEGLNSIPFAEGMNNHMGSRATSDLRVMRIVLGHLKQRGYFFLDSNVVSTTVGPDVAEEYGIRFAKRDVFIDNDLNKDKIIQQLQTAKKIAFNQGSVVVIGHDRKVTLQAIKEVAPSFEKEGIRFVLVKDLVKPAGE